MSGNREGHFGPDWPHRDRSRYVRVLQKNVHYQLFGTDGPCILLLHGTGASTHSMRDLAPELANSARVLVLDLPGHGESDMPPASGLTIEGMAERVHELCEAIDFEPEIVVGHSAGAAVGLEMALGTDRMIKTVVGLNAALEPMQGYTIFSPLAKMLFVNPFVPSLFASYARRPHVARRLIEQTGSELDARGLSYYQRLFADRDHVAGALGMMASWDLNALRRRMGMLRSELVLVNALDDRTVPARNAHAQAASVRSGRTITLPEGGHLVHETDPARIAHMIVNLTKSQALRGAA